MHVVGIPCMSQSPLPSLGHWSVGLVSKKQAFALCICFSMSYGAMPPRSARWSRFLGCAIRLLQFSDVDDGKVKSIRFSTIM